VAGHGVDALLTSLPASLRAAGFGIEFADGRASVGDAFREPERAWTPEVAAMARGGARVVDDVFLVGTLSQERWHEALDDLRVLWGRGPE
jgi:chloramphenicol 3-O phosphotransferase